MYLFCLDSAIKINTYIEIKVHTSLEDLSPSSYCYAHIRIKETNLKLKYLPCSEAKHLNKN